MNPHASGPGGDGRLMPSAQLAFQAGRESWQEKLSAPHDAAGAPLWVAV
ncbi:MAG: hypothetical protein JO089_02075 [Alphaproteobacteria bacterium]|nr:hypothetical protein [Alphaproteobacteria bacterium]